MRVSVSITNYDWPGEPAKLRDRLVAVVTAAERAGIDTVWIADHLIQPAPNAPRDGAMLEAYTALGFLAGRTSRVRLGTMVTAVTYREPSLLLKAVTTLDVLSSGRAWLGLGAGYHEEESRWLGLSMPPTRERFERLEDTLRLARQMWAGDDSAFESAHYHLERPISSPPPVSRPHPPILVGGTGERRTLRLVAEYADACNLFDLPDRGETIRHKLSVLAAHCDEVGRPYGEIEKTANTRFDADDLPEELAARLSRLASIGIEHAVLITDGPWTERMVATVGAAIPLVAAN